MTSLSLSYRLRKNRVGGGGRRGRRRRRRIIISGALRDTVHFVMEICILGTLTLPVLT